MFINENKLADIDGLVRSESVSKDDLGAMAFEMTHAVYPHDDLYGKYCSIQEYIDCPPEDVFNYLSDVHSLSEWTFSTRQFTEVDGKGLYAGEDVLETDTKIFCKVVANREAMTVDYHCAWDQGIDLWMIYLMRVVPAELVLKKPGSIVFWSNCRHPYYDDNPFPGTVPQKDRPWVGEYWDLFYAGHTVEMQNLKKILEHRHRENQFVGPYLLAEEVAA
jgi:hypothetical protein